jgi:DNA-binding NtrC family response regulator
MRINIVHLDDDLLTLERFSKILSKENSTVDIHLMQFQNTESMFAKLKNDNNIDVFVLDVSLSEGDKNGIEVAKICRNLCPESAILMCSASKNLNFVRESLASGADDFITKEWDSASTLKRIEFAINLRKIKLKQSKTSLDIAGSTMKSIEQRIPQLIQSAINCIYIEGESGTGKEVVVELFQFHSPKDTPFIKVNCATIPPTLIQSELFGHTKGAFTGANSDKKGLLESAHGGWIFLDEIATLTLEAQAGLLRAIENQTIRRVGANQELKLSFRVISATNEPLSNLVEQGKFRKDLWQRLCETQIQLPPLRARKGEITELAQFFCGSMRGGPYSLAPLVLEALKSYDWVNGNIRELRNCLRAMTENASDGILTPSSIPSNIWQRISDKGKPTDGENTDNQAIIVRWSEEQRPSFDALSARLLLEIIRAEYRKNGTMSMRAAAKAAGIPKSTMASKIEQILNLNLISRKELHLLIKSMDSGDIGAD